MAVLPPFIDQISLPAVFLLGDGTKIVVNGAADVEQVPKDVMFERTGTTDGITEYTQVFFAGHDHQQKG